MGPPFTLGSYDRGVESMRVHALLSSSREEKEESTCRRGGGGDTQAVKLGPLPRRLLMRTT